MKPLPGPKFLKSKVFENKFFQVITETLFETKIFQTDTQTFFETKDFETETFFRDQIFSRPKGDFFLRLNIFETDTETFFETKIFETETDTLKKLRKVSIPRSLETRCHTLICLYDDAIISSLGHILQLCNFEH